MTLKPGWQPPNLAAAKARGVTGVIARCSIGAAVDPFYAPTITAARAAPITAAAYHWTKPYRYGATAELDAIERGLAGGAPDFFMLDVEDGQITWRDDQLLDWVFGILSSVDVERRVIYTGFYWWNARVSNVAAARYATEFARYDVMVAAYPHQAPVPAGVAQTARWPIVPQPAQWYDWASTTQRAPDGTPDDGKLPLIPNGWDRWDGWQFSSWALAADYGFPGNARLDCNVVNPEAWARWAPEPEEPLMAETLYPAGYVKDLVTMAELRRRYESKMEPEYARRLFNWLPSRGGKIGIGGGRRIVQPSKPGFAPAGKSFHQDQRFADGSTWYCAVDLVTRVPGQNHSSGAIRVNEVPLQGSADAARWGVHINVGTPNNTGFEVWHMQAVEMDGFDSWASAGRKRPRAGYPIPGTTPPPKPPEEDDDDMFSSYWQLNGGPVFALYKNGTKIWMPNDATFACHRNLTVLAGGDTEVHNMTDPNMFRAFGPVVGPVPPGANEWGI
jgi:hypothetical protein